jgi:integrase
MGEKFHPQDFHPHMKKLKDIAVKNAKPGQSVRKMSDGNGLVLIIHPNGSKYWSYRYRYLGKEKSLSLGVYPEVSLAEARDKLMDARKLVSAGDDPSEVKKAKKRQKILSAENHFEAVAREWHKSRLNTWSENYAGKVMTSMEQDVFPKIGSRPIAEIMAPELLAMLRIVEKRGAIETAHRIKQNCGLVFSYAIATGRAERNPAADLKMALSTPKREHNKYLKAEELPEFLEKLNAYPGYQTKLALRFLLLTFVRTIELRGAEWSEIDFDKAEWRIPAERMKMRQGHIVPLSEQALAILKELKLLNGQWRYVFPNERKPIQHISENNLLYALYRMGYHGRATGHGFRATASTILNEHGFSTDHIERQLAHAERNKVRAAYNHAQYLPERRKMMQWWADYLDSISAVEQREKSA